MIISVSQSFMRAKDRTLTYGSDASCSCTGLTDSRIEPSCLKKKSPSRRSAVKENTFNIKMCNSSEGNLELTDTLFQICLNLKGSFASNEANKQVSPQKLLKMLTYKAFWLIPTL